MGDLRDLSSEQDGAGVPAVQVTVNVSGVVTEEALAVIAERVEASVAAAIDEARRFRTDASG